MATRSLTVESVQADGACAEGVAWLKEHEHLEPAALAKALLAKNPDWWAWAANKGYDVIRPLTAADVSKVARRAPWAAAVFLANRLSAGDISEVARRDPWAAAEFLAARLSADDVSKVARRDPWSAAKCLAGRLTAADRAVIIAARPDLAGVLT